MSVCLWILCHCVCRCHLGRARMNFELELWRGKWPTRVVAVQCWKDSSLVPRLYIREERAWYTLLAHAPDLHGNPQKNVGYYRTCYGGDPHAQAVCTRPSPPVVYRGPGNEAS